MVSMSGEDEQQDSVFSYRRTEDRIAADHPLRKIRPLVDAALQDMWAHFQALYPRLGAALDRAGAAVARAVAADFVLPPQRAAADGTDRLQPAVSLVCGHERGRTGVGRDDVQQEPGAATERRGDGAPAGGGGGASAGAGVAE